MSVRLKISSRPGMTDSSVEPAEDLHHVVLDLGPRLLQAFLGIELLTPEAVGDRRADRPQRDVEGVGQGVGRVGRQHDRP